MPNTDEQNDWDRLPGESAKAYESFCAYRDLGRSRSMLTAYRQKTSREQAERINGVWNAWSQTFEWTKRARAYDIYLERLARKAKEDAHFADVEAFRKRQMQFSRAAAAASEQLLIKATQRLLTLTQNDITPKMLASMFRAAAIVGLVSGNAEAGALGIDELIASLEELDGDGDAH